MAFNLCQPFSLFLLVALSALWVNFCSCLPAVATWYGPTNGAGSGGGACGFGPDILEKPPLSSMISAGNANLFKSSKGCGTCYQVKCSQHPACSGLPVTVTITDECPGACNNEPFHFDLSGTAFGALAKPGQGATLRNAGRINIEFNRVQCNYRAWNIAFHVDAGSNPNYFAVVIEYENGDGDLALVELQPSGSTNWLPMQQSWGATWKIDISPSTKAPFSLRLTTAQTRKTLVANSVIPVGWTPGRTYWSIVNF